MYLIGSFVNAFANRKLENMFIKHYAPNRKLVPKEGSSQNMKVRKECNSSQLKS